MMNKEWNRSEDRLVPVPFQVKSKKRETHNTYTLDLIPPNEKDFRFLPGQFNMLYSPGVGEVPISISGDPSISNRLVHTIRDVGATTQKLCSLKRGEFVGVCGPYGSSWPVVNGKGVDLLIIGGGIGLAPLRPALYQALIHREQFQNLCLLYGARSPRDIIYYKELQKLRSRFDLQVEVSVDHSMESTWDGCVGPVTKLLNRAVFDPSIARALVCGPEIMIRFVVKSLLLLGLHKSSIFVSMERNMKCAVGFCGHCQFGPYFICKDGPVFSWEKIEKLFPIKEL
jgi:NAD(P)H-flavin reductase